MKRLIKVSEGRDSEDINVTKTERISYVHTTNKRQQQSSNQIQPTAGIGKRPSTYAPKVSYVGHALTRHATAVINKQVKRAAVQARAAKKGEMKGKWTTKQNARKPCTKPRYTRTHKAYEFWGSEVNVCEGCEGKGCE